ncbi:hypothetical protein ACTSNR_005042, partial [Salmonella enterica subsp. enterica serovar Newport]
GYVGYYPAWERASPDQGYVTHRWYASQDENGAVPDTVKVCLRRQPTTGQSSNGCQALRLLGAGGTDPWPRVPVRVDIPKLTVYIGPIWDGKSRNPDTQYNRTPDEELRYGDAGCALLQKPLSIDGYRYAYGRSVMGSAPTPLSGTMSQRSDYNMAPGQVLRGAWVPPGGAGNLPPGAIVASSAAQLSGSGVADRTWEDKTHIAGDGQGHVFGTTLMARMALAPVSAPGDDVNYVAGWRHDTSDHSVAMINVKAGATAGTAMTQQNGTSWAAGGIVCVLDRQ